MANAEATLKKTLEKIAEETRLLTYNVNVKKISSDGANFLSVIYEGTISSPNKQDIKLFIKIATLPKAMRNQIPLDLIYEAEINAYTKMRTAFEELQMKYEILDTNKYNFAKFYTSSLEVEKEFIILEDLVSKGFSMYDRFKPVNWEYASKVVEELAKFHALSVAFKKEYPEVYSSVTKEEQHETLLDKMYDLTTTAFKLMSSSCAKKIPEALEFRFEKFTKAQFEKETFLKYYGACKWGFIVHGDFRPSNVMFKRQGGKIKQLIPVDYQAIRMGSPAIDLLYFIYCGTDVQFRKRHLKQLLDHYYETLSKFLEKLDINPGEFFTREEFYEDFKLRHNFGLFTAIMQLPAILAEKHEEHSIQSFSQDNKLFDERFLDILNEFVELGAL